MTSTVVNPPIPESPHHDLLQAFKGKHLHDIQTPHLVIDRGIYVKNCERMKNAVERLGWDFRAHIKTHKTAEGTRLQCQKTGTKRIIVSTLPEAWTVINAGLIADGTVTDVRLSNQINRNTMR
jgi:D-serine deaminase-like pyridoxal phosphate-dependent protein